MRVSLKLRQTEEGFLHWCAGCNNAHHIWTIQRHPNGAVWDYDGNHDSPTFNPSIKLSGKQPMSEEQYQRCLAGEDVSAELGPYVCHYFIHGGIQKFCSDCTHSLAGKEVPLPDFPD